GRLAVREHIANHDGTAQRWPRREKVARRAYVMPRRVCVVTGSRADFGFLIEPMRRLARDPDFALQTLVCGAHWSPSLGNTYQSVEEAGFTIDGRVDM